jgi:hypothetical protein
MPLTDELVREMFTKPGFSAALFCHGNEIAIPGYARCPIDSWTVEKNKASARLEWQCDSFSVFDEVVIFRSGRVIDRQPFGGDVTIPPKAVFRHGVVVRVDG